MLIKRFWSQNFKCDFNRINGFTADKKNNFVNVTLMTTI